MPLAMTGAIERGVPNNESAAPVRRRPIPGCPHQLAGQADAGAQ